MKPLILASLLRSPIAVLEFSNGHQTPIMLDPVWQRGLASLIGAVSGNIIDTADDAYLISLAQEDISVAQRAQTATEQSLLGILLPDLFHDSSSSITDLQRQLAAIENPRQWPTDDLQIYNALMSREIPQALNTDSKPTFAALSIIGLISGASLVIGTTITAGGDVEGLDFQMVGAIKLYENSVPADGQVLIGDTTAGQFDLATLTPGTGIAITNAAGSITISLASGDFPAVVQTLALINQGAAIAPTNFTGVVAPGTYQLNYTLEDTTQALGAGTIQLSVGYTNDAGAASQTSATVTLTSLGAVASGIMVIQLASGAISYAAVLAGIISTAKYALYMTMTRLS